MNTNHSIDFSTDPALGFLHRGDFDSAWKAAEEGIGATGTDRCQQAYWHFRFIRASLINIRGNTEEAVHYLESLGSPCNQDVASKASLSMFRGYWLAMLGNYKLAIALLAEAAALASSAGLFALQGEVKVRQAMTAYMQYDFNLSYALYLSVVNTQAEQCGAYLYCVALCGVAKSLMAQRQFQEALVWFDKSMAVARESDFNLLYAGIVSEIGVCYTGLGELDKALDIHLEANNILCNIGALQYYQVNLADTGNVYLCKGEFLTAISYYHRALEIAKQMKHTVHIEKWTSNIRTAYTKLQQSIEETSRSK